MKRGFYPKVKMKIISDITLNIFASGGTAVILQFLVYPFINKEVSPFNFGNILLMMSMVNIVGVLLGNSLNNIRLILEKEYKKEDIKGDFLGILLLAGVVNILLCTCIISIVWSFESLLNSFLLVLISLFTMLRGYLTVGYRLELNFKKILYHAMVHSIALLIGILILMITGKWQMVFLIGEMLSFLYLIRSTNLLKEPLVFSIKFKNTLKQYIYLSFSNLIANILIYVDRMIIFTYLGAQQVAIYFAATVIGKMSSFILLPISGVVLSYISHSDNKLSLKKFILLNIGILIFSFVAAIITFITSRPLIKILYPDLNVQSFEILLIANLAVILLASTSVPQTLILKHSATYFQILIQTVYGIIYVGLGIILIDKHGLIGFCYAALSGALSKYILIFLIGIFTLKKNSVTLK